MNKLLLTIVAILISAITYGQSTVTGKVIEKGNNESLPGVSIIIKGTLKGVTTDFDGNFSMMC